MQINSNTPSFTGYDARPLTGLFVTDKHCAEALKRIANKTGLDVYTPNIASKSIKKEYSSLMQKQQTLWAQDYLSFFNSKLKFVIFDNSRDFIKRVLRGMTDGLKKTHGIMPLHADPHLRGGNFFVCDVNGVKKLLVTENKASIYPEDLFKKIFDVEEIHPIPKLDYHLDLFIRPLDKGNVLVADDEMTKSAMRTGIEKLKNYLSEHSLSSEEKTKIEQIINNIDLMVQKLEITQKFSPYKSTETTPQVIKAIKNAGMNPIRVPGTYVYLEKIRNVNREREVQDEINRHIASMTKEYNKAVPNIQAAAIHLNEIERLANLPPIERGMELHNFYENNFINAIVTKKDDKLIYITNASLLDKTLEITPDIETKTGFSMKNAFIESISPYIDKENIFFMDEPLTERLFKLTGGIHCTAAEIV